MKRKTGSKIVALLIIAGLFLFCSCGKDVGIIGGADGPTVIVLPSGNPKPGLDTEEKTSEPAVVTPPQPTGPVQMTARYHVLMYHNLCEDESGVNGETITAAKFDDDMRWLTENGYTTMLPSELQGKSEVPEKTVVITFDDGYKSNYTLAYPILKQYNVKAMISLITSCVDNSDTYKGFMSWDEAKELADSGLVEIGSHTHNLHNPENAGKMYAGGKNGVDRAPSAQALKEDLITSRDLIEKNIGIKPVSFTYPYGAATAKDYKAAVNAVFPVNFNTVAGDAYLPSTIRIPRCRVDQNTSLESILK
ncbi:MAG: polysaccharide deacetylase family protein [Firmicutes bacterium]|nr:polysaccharide deacetylase family protein [Bacillota bacterium]MBR6025679.1 polysaccharide deacetylase family protein [Bacillota bacterium]